jgi:hypothetical protein
LVTVWGYGPVPASNTGVPVPPQDTLERPLRRGTAFVMLM